MTGEQDRSPTRFAPTTPGNCLARPIPLPNELVGSVLGFLDLRDLRVAAAVSRQFYHAAWNAGLYIKRVSSDLEIPRVQADVEAWKELVEHALSKDLRLALMLKCSWREYQSDTRRCILEMISVLSRSFPVLLALSVTVPDSMFYETCAALQRPAPRLRSFFLDFDVHYLDICINLSTGLFAGYAPSLREVGLGCPVVDACALPIFSNVTRLSTHSWECSPAVSLALHFPKLEHLYVVSSEEDTDTGRPSIDPSGVTLATLTFNDEKWPPEQLSVIRSFSTVSVDIPVLQYYCHNETFMDWQNPLGWLGATRSINMCLKAPSRELSVLVSPSDHAWRRTYSFQYFDRETPIPLANMPGLCARLEYLRLDDVVLHGFLLFDATFPALRRVRIDLAQGFGWASPRVLFPHSLHSAQRGVHCPALDVLAFTAVHPWWEPVPDPAYIVWLRLSDVFLLWSTLGLAAKPALELCQVAVDVSESCEATSLCDIFSSVSYVQSYCGMPCPVFDSALWDDEPDPVVTDAYVRQSLAR